MTGRARLRVALALGLLLAATVASGVTATPVPNDVCPAPSTADLWDVAQGSAIATSSGFGAGVGENMFGAEGSSAEPGTAFFADGNPAGFTAFVEWTTPEPMTIRSFLLWAAHDGNTQQRSFTDFRLYAVADDDTTTLLHEFTPELPYGGGEDGNVLRLCDDIVSPVESARYRAEFDQNGGFTFPGTRVFELDGYDVALASVLPTPTAPPITPAPTPAPTPVVTAPPVTPAPATQAPTPTAEPGDTGGGGDSTVLIVGAAVLAVLLVGGLWLLTRRRRRDASGMDDSAT